MSSKILGIVPIAMAVGLAGDIYSKAKKKKKRLGDFFGMAGESIIGTTLIRTSGGK